MFDLAFLSFESDPARIQAIGGAIGEYPSALTSHVVTDLHDYHPAAVSLHCCICPFVVQPCDELAAKQVAFKVRLYDPVGAIEVFCGAVAGTRIAGDGCLNRKALFAAKSPCSHLGPSVQISSIAFN